MISGKRGVAQPSYRSRTGYHGMLVGGAALLASALLAVGNEGTKDAIAQRLAEDVKAMLSEVVPPSLHDNDMLQSKLMVDGKEVYQARVKDDVTAVAYQVEEPGYSGIITLIMAVNNEGKLLGVRVVSHTETPGLGDKMEEARSPWIHSFEGQELSEENEAKWAVKKDGGQFDQFTGATITPRAAVKAIKGGMVFFQQHQDQLLNYGSDSTPEVGVAPAKMDDAVSETESATPKQVEHTPEQSQEVIQHG